MAKSYEEPGTREFWSAAALVGLLGAVALGTEMLGDV